MMQPISVRQLNLYVKSILDGDTRLADIAVIGEVSNFKNHYSSGHWYFTLKDKDATVKCVMFKAANSRVRFEVSDGLQVIVRARASLYERDGSYQLYVEDMLPEGDGGIALAFEQTKAKLEAEGLFDQSQKRPLPLYPKRIAVITSKTGAAVRDILSITERRYPICEILMRPVSVQGELAVGEMINALEEVYTNASADLIIIGRGGGSAEDLWAFNDEKLARKIYESPIPVISAVGHETDFTICDFVADLRAATPSAAAELAVPDISELKDSLSNITSRLLNAVNRKFELSSARLEQLNSRVSSKLFLSQLENKSQSVDRLDERLRSAVRINYETAFTNFSNTVSNLDKLSPLKVMSRGFAVAERDKKIVRSVNELNVSDRIKIVLADGTADCLVEEISNERKY